MDLGTLKTIKVKVMCVVQIHMIISLLYINILLKYLFMFKLVDGNSLKIVTLLRESSYKLMSKSQSLLWVIKSTIKVNKCLFEFNGNTQRYKWRPSQRTWFE